MALCPAFGTGASYAPDLLAAIDCDAASFAHLGFDALSAPGSPAMLAIGGMLTLLVALTGYRLILGGTLDPGHAVVTMFKIGLTLALATQWPAYETVFYNSVIKGPAELLARLPLAETTDSQNLAARLQASYDVLAELEMPQQQLSAQQSAALKADPLAAAQGATRSETSYGSFLSFRPASAGLFLLFSGLFALVLPRIIAGFMLALGPIFIGFLLFDATRSIFLGWVRALAWTIVATVFTAIILDIELGIAEAEIGALLDRIGAGESSLAILGELIATSLLFCLLSLGAMIAALAPTRIRAWPIRLPASLAPMFGDALRPEAPAAATGTTVARSEPAPTRAEALGSRLAITARNEAGSPEAGGAGSGERRIELLSDTRRREPTIPLGQSYREAAAPRRTAIAVRRAATK